MAALLASLPSKEAGRYLFCVADAICGWIILLYRRQRRKNTENLNIEKLHLRISTSSFLTPQLEDALWWLYNPLAINICTRGSAESLVVLLPVLCTLWIATFSSFNKDKYSTPYFCVAAVTSGLCHGVAIHAKLYPVIYTVSFMTAFATKPIAVDTDSTSPTKSFPYRIFLLTKLWFRRLVSPAPVLFVISSLLTFGGLTYAAVVWFGDIALHEGLLYHFSRVDHRHNYSMHWYWIYLARDRVGSKMGTVGRLLLLPQIVLLACTSLGIAPHNLSLALFVQTFLFVAHNKVITAQYFSWYLCLLPLCSDQFRWTRRVRVALILLGLSIVGWLGSAYCLEMQGMAVHRVVWIASLLYFICNVNVLVALLASSQAIAFQPHTSLASKKTD